MPVHLLISSNRWKYGVSSLRLSGAAITLIPASRPLTMHCLTPQKSRYAAKKSFQCASVLYFTISPPIAIFPLLRMAFKNSSAASNCGKLIGEKTNLLLLVKFNSKNLFVISLSSTIKSRRIGLENETFLTPRNNSKASSRDFLELNHI